MELTQPTTVMAAAPPAGASFEVPWLEADCWARVISEKSRRQGSNIQVRICNSVYSYCSITWGAPPCFCLGGFCYRYAQRIFIRPDSVSFPLHKFGFR